MPGFVHDTARWMAVGQLLNLRLETLHVEAEFCRRSDRGRVDRSEKLRQLASQKQRMPATGFPSLIQHDWSDPQQLIVET